MRAVVSRVSRASVSVEDLVVSEIGAGILILLGIAEDDGEEDLIYIVNKCLNLRIFDNSDGKELSVKEIGGKMLLVSQFTLYGDARKGRRPSYIQAARSGAAEILYRKCIERFKESGIIVKTGEFGAMMDVSSVNHGPVTILLDSRKEF